MLLQELGSILLYLKAQFRRIYSDDDGNNNHSLEVLQCSIDRSLSLTLFFVLFWYSKLSSANIFKQNLKIHLSGH